MKKTKSHRKLKKHFYVISNPEAKTNFIEELRTGLKYCALVNLI